MTVPARKIFVAGSTGATGRALLRLAERAGVRHQLVPHQRNQREGKPADAVIMDLGDAQLAKAMRGFTTVVQLIGTMRKRFADGDTYETSDIGTTEQLVYAAKLAGVDHIVLLSSVGAGSPFGAYLKAKARAEAIVRDSGIAWTIFRPSAFYGEGHKAPSAVKPLLRAVGLSRYEPIAVDDLVAGILSAALARAPLGVALEGKSLWNVVTPARAQLQSPGGP